MPNVIIIYTGGTLGGKIDQSTQMIKEDFDTNGLLHKFKKDFDFSEEGIVDFVKPFKKLSEQMGPSDWISIASSVDKAIKQNATGVVILHGTDTLSYTASMLSFMLTGIKIPVVLTGSNIAYTAKNTDAKKNIRDALFIARQNNFSGVYAVFSGSPNKNSQVHLGTRVTKRYFDNYYSYVSINYTPIGEIIQKSWTTNLKFHYIMNEVTFQKIKNNLSTQPYKLIDKIISDISHFKIYPVFNPRLIDYEVEKGTKGIILELYGSGTACTQGKYSIIPPLQRAITAGIPVFATSQHYGDLKEVSYGSSGELKETGVVFLKDMLTETAIVKLMWILGMTDKNTKDVVDSMLKNMRGEINED